MQAISDAKPGPQMQAISKLTTGGGVGGSLVKKEQGKDVVVHARADRADDPDQAKFIRLAIAELRRRHSRGDACRKAQP